MQIAESVGSHARTEGISLPTDNSLANLLHLAFFTSLTREEGVPVRVDLVLIDPAATPSNTPESGVHPTCIPFGGVIPLQRAADLAKIAPAADPWASALAVWEADNGWFAWAIVDQQIHFNRRRFLDDWWASVALAAYRVSVERQGRLTISYGDKVLIRQVHDEILSRPARLFSWGLLSPQLLEPMKQRFMESLACRLGLNLEALQGPSWLVAETECERALKRLLLLMSRYGHGGALLIDPNEPGSDLNVKHKLSYDRLWTALQTKVIATRNMFYLPRGASGEMEDGDDRPAALAKLDNARETAQAEVAGSIHTIASLSRVDGLVLMSDRLSLRGFGVEIRSENDPPCVLATTDEWVSPAATQAIDPRTLGMRHRSMMRYCYAHSDTVGFVVSQDGPVRAMLRVEDYLIFWRDIEIEDEPW